MLSLSLTSDSVQDGPRAANLRTDLAAIADLIELVFAHTMDEGGRAAIREMRSLARLGPGLGLMASLNEMALGIKMGYVWIEQGQLVGNVSVYPANWPADLGETWIIANVGVHPQFQRRGIARRLMQLSLDMLALRRAKRAILQVDYDNHPAIHLYESLGFIRERAWATWRRSSFHLAPPANQQTVFITRRRPSEWRAEMALAQRLRPAEQGGLGWLKPLHVYAFNPPWTRRLQQWLKMSSTERLIVRSADERELLASLWIENSFGVLSTRLLLLADPNHPDAAEALLSTTIRRFRTSTLLIEHPEDDLVTGHLLASYRFQRERSVWHMRWDVP
ncbi:MAG: GNAT family N-acetyltransferase [Anaerolineae bacterium]|nr:GNAT family N-acetyltransferase [Anaerolineae bacterium]MDW8173909.1 GNAT family N-acetyltransferase [Anaerolineae bacterium]